MRPRGGAAAVESPAARPVVALSVPAVGPSPFLCRARLVTWAKVLLPLAALLLLSTLFLVARAPEGASAPLPLIDAIAREPRVDRPRLAGVAADGTDLVLSADRLRPLAGGAVALDAPRLEAVGADGRRARLAAATGESRGPTLALGGGVRLEAEGVVATAPAVRADLWAGTAESAGPVLAAAPFGSLEAGTMSLDRDRVAFGGGVRLVHLPRVASGAAP
jgi:lipopolysaccharide export system protein LptC